jgi:hypothetical protein
MIFSVGDRIAHPMHGAGVIDSIEKRKIDGAGVLCPEAAGGGYGGHDPQRVQR